MKKHTLKAEKRTILGRKVKSLRAQGLIPANLFGKKITSLAVTVNQSDFHKVHQEVGETGLVDLLVGKIAKPVLISNLQLDPVSGSVLHVDFHQVDLKEKVTAPVPVELIGESPAEKQGLGNVVQQINEIEVEALPTDLPENLKADLSLLTEVDQAILAKDLKYDSSKVTLQIDPNQIIAKVEPPQKEEEIAPKPAEEIPAESAPAEEGQASSKPAETVSETALSST